MLFIHAWPSAIHLVQCGYISPFSEEHLQEFEATPPAISAKTWCNPTSCNPLFATAHTYRLHTYASIRTPIAAPPPAAGKSRRQSQTGSTI